MAILVNQHPIKHFNFSGGECHVSIEGIELKETVQVSSKIYNSDDLIKTILTIDAIKRQNIKSKIELTIPYFPYARQDRVCNPGEAYSLEVICKMINSMEVQKVSVFDPHSQVTPNLLNNCEIIHQARLIEQSPLGQFIRDQKLTLVAPDQGATNKTERAAFVVRAPAIYCSKKRDPKSGEILETQIPNEVTGKNLILIDDICDGGRTFIELAKKLKSQGAGDLYLYVTHGIFSKGLSPLKEFFQHTFCYHSFLDSEQIDSNFLTVLEE